jgi:hypothetical protein
LCFEFSQITRTTPWREITLHLSQIFLTEALTFIAVVLRSLQTRECPLAPLRAFGGFE